MNSKTYVDIGTSIESASRMVHLVHERLDKGFWKVFLEKNRFPTSVKSYEQVQACWRNFFDQIKPHRTKDNLRIAAATIPFVGENLALEDYSKSTFAKWHDEPAIIGSVVAGEKWHKIINWRAKAGLLQLILDPAYVDNDDLEEVLDQYYSLGDNQDGYRGAHDLYVDYGKIIGIYIAHP